MNEMASTACFVVGGSAPAPAGASPERGPTPADPSGSGSALTVTPLWGLRPLSPAFVTRSLTRVVVAPDVAHELVDELVDGGAGAGYFASHVVDEDGKRDGI